MTEPELLLNRELTWLAFNSRVLHEVEDDRTPLLERVKFLSIVGSNLDEFFMKRIGGLMQQEAVGLQNLSVDGRTPGEQIRECLKEIRHQEQRQQAAFAEIQRLLAAHDITIQSFEALNSASQIELREKFSEEIFPLVTPQVVDPAHPFPFVSNLSLNLIVELRESQEAAPVLARVKVPIGAGIPRFMTTEKGQQFVPLESVIAANLDLLFPGSLIESASLFRVTRNVNTERDEEGADDLLAMIETEMRDRRFAPIVRLEVSNTMPDVHRSLLAGELLLDPDSDVFPMDGLMGQRDLMQIAALKIPALHYPAFAPVDHPAFARPGRSVFRVIRDEGSVLLHHPYQSYATSVERFLREASEDSKVRAIKMTLYRTDQGSKVIEHLIRAAHGGKQVAVVVELKARFEEERNIRWAGRLEEAGVHVTYGVLGLKTHCKTVLVVRQESGTLRRYAHIGTGNYNADTARLYSDLGLLTADKKIGQDLTELFNYLTTGIRPKRKYHKLLPSPKHCKAALLQKIQREIELHSAEESGLIQIKTNALEDPEVTRALYAASEAGVRVDLIVRDSCRIRPGLSGVSEQVRVVSLVGRFLEHARVYYFRAGGEDEYYIGSADTMSRNLENRVEVLAPVEAPKAKKDVRFFLDTQLADQRCAWDMDSDGGYTQRVPDEGKPQVSSQEIFIEWAMKRYRQATRLKTRGLKGGDRSGRRSA